jgi:hypothetical protein
MSAGVVNPPPAQPAVITDEVPQLELEDNKADETREGVIQTLLTLLQSVLSGL